MTQNNVVVFIVVQWHTQKFVIHPNSKFASYKFGVKSSRLDRLKRHIDSRSLKQLMVTNILCSHFRPWTRQPMRRVDDSLREWQVIHLFELVINHNQSVHEQNVRLWMRNCNDFKQPFCSWIRDWWREREFSTTNDIKYCILCLPFYLACLIPNVNRPCSVIVVQVLLPLETNPRKTTMY